jgi:hypothetical protein
MGPSIGLVILMFAVIAAVVIGSLLLMPGWKSSLALFAAYAAGLTYVSLTPALADGQMNRGGRRPCLARAGARRTCPWRDAGYETTI